MVYKSERAKAWRNLMVCAIVDFLNPASNWRQASLLRLINPGADPVR